MRTPLVAVFTVALFSQPAAAQRVRAMLSTPEERVDPAVVGLSDGGALVLGGHHGADVRPSVWRVEPGLRAVRVLGDAPETIDPHGVFALPHEQVLALSMTTGRAYLFDASRERWSTPLALGTPRRDAAGVRIRNGDVLLCGGVAVHDGAALASCERFDVRRGSFVRGPTMRIARAAHALTALADGAVLALGGHSNVDGRSGTLRRFVPLDTVERLAPGSRRFSLTTRLAQPRYGLSAIALGAGAVLVAGGTGDYGENWGIGEELIGGPVRRAGAASCGGSSAERSLGATLLPLRDGGALLLGSLGGAALRRYSRDGRCGVELDDLRDFGEAGWALLADGSVLGVGPRAVLLSVP